MIVSTPNRMLVVLVAAALCGPLASCTEVIPVYPTDGGIGAFATGDPTGLDASTEPEVAPSEDSGPPAEVTDTDGGTPQAETMPLDTGGPAQEIAQPDAGPDVGDAAPIEDATEEVAPEIAQPDSGPGEPDAAEDVDEGPIDCCENVTCGPFDECSLLTCDCVALYPDPCQFDGDTCNPEYPQPSPWVCVQYGPLPETGICRQGCLATGTVADDPCPNGMLCGALPGADGWCLPQTCTGFFLNDCGPDATCLPLLAGDGACVPDGEGFYGSPCGLHDECAHNMLCIDGICSSPDCTPFSDTEKCLPGVQCMPLAVGVSELDAGFCAAPCEVFQDEGCAQGQWCYPLLNTPKPGNIDGHCIIANGPAGLGDDCSLNPNVCAVGLTCVADPDQNLACEQLCDPAAKDPGDAGACPPTRSCVPLLVTDDSAQLVEVMDFGSCVPGCEPWVGAEQSGCAAEQWCQPAMFNPAVGECNGALGALPEAAPCSNEDFDTSCQDGLMCLGLNSGGVLTGVCVLLCDPAGPPGDTCSGEQYCDTLEFIGSGGKKFSLGIGICQPPPGG